MWPVVNQMLPKPTKTMPTAIWHNLYKKWLNKTFLTKHLTELITVNHQGQIFKFLWIPKLLLKITQFLPIFLKTLLIYDRRFWFYPLTIIILIIFTMFKTHKFSAANCSLFRELAALNLWVLNMLNMIRMIIVKG